MPEHSVETGEEPSLGSLVNAQNEAFRRHLGRGERSGTGAGPVRTFFAPGRVNLMGAHLDYNGGPVMPTAIDRGTLVSVCARGDRRVRMVSEFDTGLCLEFDLNNWAERPQGLWSDYPVGVVRELLPTADQPCGMNLYFGGNLPIGAGLSSSASVCVATAWAVRSLWGLEATDQDLVDVALRAERGFVGVHCGIMDPHAVGLARGGHLLWLDCKDGSYEHVRFDGEQLCIGVADTGVRRSLAQGEFNRRVAECHEAFEVLRLHVPSATCLRDVSIEDFERFKDRLDPVVRRRAQHVVQEVERAFAAREDLRAGRPEGLGRAMSAAHVSLRDLFEVSCPELDTLVDAALEVDGVLGGRLTGAGFGGCIVTLVRRDAREQLKENLVRRFSREYGREPTVEFYSGGVGPSEY